MVFSPAMNDNALTLQFARDGSRLKVSFSQGNEKALRSYEIHEVDWEQVKKTRKELLAGLQRANQTGNLAREAADGLKRAGGLLFDLLLPIPIREKLTGTLATLLTLHLEDTLVHLPWELLYDGREFLCRRFAVGRIASTRQAPTARSARALKPPFKVLILADPRGDLEACYREGLDIKAFLEAKSSIFQVDFKSCPVELAYAKNHLRDYDIVHYAGHAVYDALSPNSSGWLLTDGILKASEIIAMGGFQAMPALVFANACRSGRSDEPCEDEQEEQFFGLANAFLLAGVEHYIGTWCDVVDGLGAGCAKRFYTAIAAGETVGSALRSARREDLTDEFDRLTWANYLLYGDPDSKFGAVEEPAAEPHDRGIDAQPGQSKLLPPMFGRKNRRSWLYASSAAVLAAGFLVAGLSFNRFSASKPQTFLIQPAASPAPDASRVLSTPLPAPLTLSMNIIGQRREPDGSYTEVIVRERSVLRSRDHFQVHVETNKPAHVYVLLFDSHGQASQLFPDPKIEHPGFVEAGREIAIPDKDLWFWLDENPGTETVYVLASETPLTDIRGLLSKMNEASDTERKSLSREIKQQIQIVERGVGGVTKGKAVSYALSDGRNIQKVTELVTGAGAAVRAVSFQHK